MSQQLSSTLESALSDGERQPHQAALLLGAMSESDRAWTLAQLSADERAVLVPLLEELEALGIPVDAQLLDAVRARAGSVAPGSSPSADEAYVLNAPAALLARVLAQEPAGLTVQLLGLHAWPWQGELLKHLPAGRAADVRASLVRHKSPSSHERTEGGAQRSPVWHASLMRALRAQLEQAGASSDDVSSSMTATRSNPKTSPRGLLRWRRNASAGGSRRS
jgi:hypothetical protein